MQHGDLPQRPLRADRSAHPELLAQREGLVPLRMEPPAAQQGLRPATFTDGLDELSVDALRANGNAPTLWRGVGNESELHAARRRATALDLNG